MTPTEQQIKFVELSRAQRAAYFAWQNAPSGKSAETLDAYRKASAEQREFEKGLDTR
jgi:hypothetical protein